MEYVGPEAHQFCGLLFDCNLSSTLPLPYPLQHHHLNEVGASRKSRLQAAIEITSCTVENLEISHFQSEKDRRNTQNCVVGEIPKRGTSR